MSMKLEMLQAARLAPNLLGESAALVRQFVRRQQNPDGGFKNRAGESDLYYTVFGLDCLVALREPIDTVRLDHYLRSFGDGGDLDFVHLTCLARCWSGRAPVETRTAILDRLGSFSPATLYEWFLACGACQNLCAPLPDVAGLLRCIGSMRAHDGACGNVPGLPVGSTTATAAAVALLRQFNELPPEEFGPWLLAQARPDGGFVAMPDAPMPDLLSTATALHALASLKFPFGHIREPCGRTKEGSTATGPTITSMSNTPATGSSPSAVSEPHDRTTTGNPGKGPRATPGRPRPARTLGRRTLRQRLVHRDGRRRACAG